MSSRTFRRVGSAGLTYILWAITTAVGIFEVALVHRIFLNLYLFLSGYEQGTKETFAARYEISATYTFSIIIIAALWLLFFLISTHYHFKYPGQAKSWRLMLWTLIVQVGIFIVDLAVRLGVG